MWLSTIQLHSLTIHTIHHQLFTSHCKHWEVNKGEKHEDLTIVDLPGAYSLSPFTSEESISRDFILEEAPDIIIDIVDASNFTTLLHKKDRELADKSRYTFVNTLAFCIKGTRQLRFLSTLRVPFLLTKLLPSSSEKNKKRIASV